MTTHPVIFFDGVCNFCNASIQLVIRNDKQGRFHFASLQSEYAKQFFLTHTIPKNIDSIVLWDGDRIYTQTSALLRIVRYLRFPWPIFMAAWFIPAFLRDPIYRFVARNRYKWFGRRESCMIPTPDIRARFIDQ